MASPYYGGHAYGTVPYSTQTAAVGTRTVPAAINATAAAARTVGGDVNIVLVPGALRPTARTVGDRCAAREGLPGVVLTWTPSTVSVDSAETVVYRRDRPRPLPGEGVPDWTVVTRLAADATTYTDHTIRGYTPTEYAVTLDYVQDGTSDETPKVPVEAYVEYDWCFIHDAADPRLWLPFHTLAGDEAVESVRTLTRVRGRERPMAFADPADAASLALNGLPAAYAERYWRLLRELHRRETDGHGDVVLCVRPGIQRERYFANIEDLDRRLNEAQYEPGLTVREVKHDAIV